MADFFWYSEAVTQVILFGVGLRLYRFSAIVLPDEGNSSTPYFRGKTSEIKLFFLSSFNSFLKGYFSLGRWLSWFNFGGIGGLKAIWGTWGEGEGGGGMLFVLFK